MTFLAVEEQMTLIQRGAEEIIPEEALKEKLAKSKAEGKPLTIKLGCDPSRADLHIGHGVVLRKLRHFQDLGHQAILVIGDFTAMIGDPSGRNKTRPQLTLEAAQENAKSYVDQAKVILDVDSLKIVYNSEWLNEMNFSDVISLTSNYTVARMLERDDFTKRFKDEVPISLHEFLYPLAQGQDSVVLEADVELGGTDQKFNLLLGRDLQRANDQEPQCIITLPLLEGTDGVEKMSKSYGNHIGLHDAPAEMFGKTLSIGDDLIEKWFVLGADASEEKMKQVRADLANEQINPMTIKRDLARSIVALYYSDEQAKEAEKHFDTVVVGKGVPDDMPSVTLKEEKSIVEIIVEAELLKSKSEARRMIKQGAVKLDEIKITNIQAIVSLKENEQILKVGKRRFLKII
ncbi:MAG: tyrosine--tRNA ligase [Candidatus Marinimicrobia bacterium]|jgi:tyrosyl-tRNA synthetase|nr:tyrosine--tRNA ligase [Candidatus Neomarinimicrobiota bacterium]MBT3496817.1 tyrosine--tRNA ligase [Candidatus Neomarinimicrobiota bacterium]MBT3692667.1 tyrosine--tRNA ligase [Candidatus Neomarinimicrobiota bacterium]MBT3732339.1 tyrosine--tRNA ligase [Candidatus Neomarinimicrobiota bacterium]MBT4144296.1 tyrosine--tRNA ligase [Candidatus Neomarinimicrobiota bacterium]